MIVVSVAADVRPAGHFSRASITRRLSLCSSMTVMQRSKSASMACAHDRVDGWCSRLHHCPDFARRPLGCLR